jgi:predicted dehydrogenase
VIKNVSGGGRIMKTIAVIGLGERGINYMRWLKLFNRKKAKTVAICDIDPVKVREVGKKFGIPNEMCFTKDNDFFVKKLADAIMICTQDRDHYKHTIAAIKLGYDILVEKPLAPTIAECEDIRDRAHEKGVRVLVCHVLRYSKYYLKVKEILRSGIIGEPVSLEHTENIGYFHFAHSFVRGNWRRDDLTTPAILAKCCHDMDLIYWFMASRCERISSYGSLSYFRKENAPRGATSRCLGGCAAKKNCPYDAERLYIKDPFWRATFIKYMPRVLTGRIHSTKREKYEVLRNGDYGRCVYMCDNNVVDHQVVAMEFEGGKTAVHTMTAFSGKMHRSTHITGTRGEIIANDIAGRIRVNIFGGKSRKYKFVMLPGHLDGDISIVSNFVRLINNEKMEMSDLTFVDLTIESHRMALAAEESRKNRGRPVEL